MVLNQLLSLNVMQLPSYVMLLSSNITIQRIEKKKKKKKQKIWVKLPTNVIIVTSNYSVLLKHNKCLFSPLW